MKKTYLTLALLLCGQWLLAQDCTAVSPQYTLDFESVATPALPDCTVAVNAGSGNNWITVNNPGSGFEDSVLAYTGNAEAANAWFFTQAIQLEAGQPYKITYKYGNNSADTTEKFKISMGSSATAEGMVTLIATYEEVTGAAAATVTTGPFYAAESGVYYFGFNVYSDASQGSLYTDNIDIDVWSCVVPEGLEVTDITTTAATLNWDAVTTGDPVQFYQISVQPGTAEAQPGPTTTTTTAPTYFPLIPATVYTAYVRSFCTGVWSDWSEGVTFTTPLCDTFATVPYLQDFESVTAPAIPECNLALAGETGNNWVTVNNPGNGFTGNTLVYEGTTEAANAWYFTKGVQLEAGQPYKITYKYGNNSADTTEKFKISMGSAATAEGMATLIATYEEVTGAAAATVTTGPFYAAESGVYYFGFNVYSDASQGSLYIDNIDIDVWSCVVPESLEVTDITTTAATLSWDAVTTGDPVQFYQISVQPGTAEAQPGPTTTTTTAPTYFPLTPETVYTVYVRSFCSGVWSDWSEGVTFTTQTPAGVNQYGFNSLRVYPNPALNTISISNGNVIDTAVLYTITGQKVLTQNIAGTDATLNVERIPAGIYLLDLSSEGATKTIKVIKE
ncbi:fibronectin type III domain-containing protein [Flavobacterium sp. RHBU_24]|uniref:fibronectin type III domain-containing protein n=1 Tax=Flavobacterium sp. RHBU_24 TaxID=3391185 RepID=UPI003985230E